ncbi:MAG TPA: hypothetical protein VFH38_01030 [Jatrophihabitans sp.]|nr:hypothetical protein [Jatrophihabitans sp.]
MVQRNTPEFLGFDEQHRTDGAYPVIDEQGRTLATVSPSFWFSRFTATDARDEPLCSGKARLISGWRALRPDGAQLLLLRVGVPKRLRTVLRDGEFECRSIGRILTREWFLQTLDGRTLLQAVPHDDKSPFPPDVWVVRSDGTLTLPEAVSIVELHRLEYQRKRRRHPAARKRKKPRMSFGKPPRMS